MNKKLLCTVLALAICISNVAIFAFNSNAKAGDFVADVEDTMLYDFEDYSLNSEILNSANPNGYWENGFGRTTLDKTGKVNGTNSMKISWNSTNIGDGWGKIRFRQIPTGSLTNEAISFRIYTENNWEEVGVVLASYTDGWFPDGEGFVFKAKISIQAQQDENGNFIAQTVTIPFSSFVKNSDKSSMTKADLDALNKKRTISCYFETPQLGADLPAEGDVWIDSFALTQETGYQSERLGFIADVDDTTLYDFEKYTLNSEILNTSNPDGYWLNGFGRTTLDKTGKINGKNSMKLTWDETNVGDGWGKIRLLQIPKGKLTNEGISFRLYTEFDWDVCWPTLASYTDGWFPDGEGFVFESNISIKAKQDADGNYLAQTITIPYSAFKKKTTGESMTKADLDALNTKNHIAFYLGTPNFVEMNQTSGQLWIDNVMLTNAEGYGNVHEGPIAPEPEPEPEPDPDPSPNPDPEGPGEGGDEGTTPPSNGLHTSVDFEKFQDVSHFTTPTNGGALALDSNKVFEDKNNSLKYTYNFDSQTSTMIAGSAGMLYGDGITFRVKTDKAVKLTLKLKSQDLNNKNLWAVYEVEIPASNEIQRVAFDWAEFTKSRGIFQEFDKSNTSMELTLSKVSDNQGEVFIDSIDYYVYSEMLSGGSDPLPPTGGEDEVEPDEEVLNFNENISTKKIIETIKETTKSTVVVNMTAANLIEESIFAQAKASGKNLRFNIVDADGKVIYSWYFDKDKIVDTDMYLDTTILIGDQVDNDDLDKLITNKDESLKLHLTHIGNFPGQAQIKIFVGDKFADGTNLELNYFNQDTNKLESISLQTVAGGYVEFNLDKASYFVLTSVKSDVSPETPETSDSSNALSILMVIAVLGGAVVLTKTCLLKKDN